MKTFHNDIDTMDLFDVSYYIERLIGARDVARVAHTGIHRYYGAIALRLDEAQVCRSRLYEDFESNQETWTRLTHE